MNLSVDKLKKINFTKNYKKIILLIKIENLRINENRKTVDIH